MNVTFSQVESLELCWSSNTLSSEIHPSNLDRGSRRSIHTVHWIVTVCPGLISRNPTLKINILDTFIFFFLFYILKSFYGTSRLASMWNKWIIKYWRLTYFPMKNYLFTIIIFFKFTSQQLNFLMNRSNKSFCCKNTYRWLR